MKDLNDKVVLVSSKRKTDKMRTFLDVLEIMHDLQNAVKDVREHRRSIEDETEGSA